MNQIFFNSSIPRSGSTLLQNILGQNPDMYVTPTSGFIDFLYSCRSTLTKGPEFRAQDPKTMETAFLGYCKAGIKGYFEAITGKPIIIDKSRGWISEIKLLTEILGEKPKIICMVRDLREVVTSMEKNHRKGFLRHNTIVNPAELKNTTTAKRVEYWLKTLPVGLALERTYQAIHEGFGKDILFVRFEDLCKTPGNEMQRVYKYLELPYYEHDFNNVEQITQEDDIIHGVLGLHDIRKKVEPVPTSSKEILGAAACEYIMKTHKWYFDTFKYN